MHQLESFFTARPKILNMLSPTGNKMNYLMDSTIIAALGSCNTKSTYVFRKRYRIHNHRVKSTVPADKLLVYNVKQGWKPLCDFLECEVPNIPFPHENIKGEIIKSLPMTRWVRQVNREVQRGALAIVSVLVIIVITVLAICFSKWQLFKNKGFFSYLFRSWFELLSFIRTLVLWTLIFVISFYNSHHFTASFLNCMPASFFNYS